MQQALSLQLWSSRASNQKVSTILPGIFVQALDELHNQARIGGKEGDACAPQHQMYRQTLQEARSKQDEHVGASKAAVLQLHTVVPAHSPQCTTAYSLPGTQAGNPTAASAAAAPPRRPWPGQGHGVVARIAGVVSVATG